MAHRLRTAALVLAVTTTTAVVAAPAHAGAPPGGPVTVVAQGLDDPFGLASEGGKFYVAESSAGEISGFVPGGRPTVRLADFAAPAGVDRRAGTLYVVTGEAQDPAATGGSTLWSSRRGEPRRVLADLMAFELANNPDGQPQFGPDGAPLDALSNPFAVLAGQGSDRRVFVADAGANDVLAVDPDGTVSAFFVPPAVTTGLCEGLENNGVADGGCDPVPTGLAWGPDGHLFVSTLSGEAPLEGRVYELDPRDGTVLGETSGFTAPTGVAVGDDGTLYVSELLEGAPAGGAAAGRLRPDDRRADRGGRAGRRPLRGAGDDAARTAVHARPPVLDGVQRGGSVPRSARARPGRPRRRRGVRAAGLRTVRGVGPAGPTPRHVTADGCRTRPRVPGCGGRGPGAAGPTRRARRRRCARSRR